MATHNPFPWSSSPTGPKGREVRDGRGILIAKCIGVDGGPQNAAMITAIPGLLQAAMQGHGWGDPLHLEAYPACPMCLAIRVAVGDRTRERILELAKMHAAHIRHLLNMGGAPIEEQWREVECLLGIADGDPYAHALRIAGEYEGIDVEILDAINPA